MTKNKRKFRIAGTAGLATGLGMVLLFDNSFGWWIAVLGTALMLKGYKNA